jgi:hypothetical protein
MLGPFPSVGHKRMFLRLVRFLLLLRAEEDEPRRRDYFRASGDVRCEACGMLYHDHAEDPILPWLHVLCSGERVKL